MADDDQQQQNSPLYGGISCNNGHAQKNDSTSASAVSLAKDTSFEELLLLSPTGATTDFLSGAGGRKSFGLGRFGLPGETAATFLEPSPTAAFSAAFSAANARDFLFEHSQLTELTPVGNNAMQLLQPPNSINSSGSGSGGGGSMSGGSGNPSPLPPPGGPFLGGYNNGSNFGGAGGLLMDESVLFHNNQVNGGFFGSGTGAGADSPDSGFSSNSNQNGNGNFVPLRLSPFSPPPYQSMNFGGVGEGLSPPQLLFPSHQQLQSQSLQQQQQQPQMLFTPSYPSLMGGGGEFFQHQQKQQQQAQQRQQTGGGGFVIVDDVSGNNAQDQDQEEDNEDSSKSNSGSNNQEKSSFISEEHGLNGGGKGPISPLKSGALAALHHLPRLRSARASPARGIKQEPPFFDYESTFEHRPLLPNDHEDSAERGEFPPPPLHAPTTTVFKRILPKSVMAVDQMTRHFSTSDFMSNNHQQQPSEMEQESGCGGTISPSQQQQKPPGRRGKRKRSSNSNSNNTGNTRAIDSDFTRQMSTTFIGANAIGVKRRRRTMLKGGDGEPLLLSPEELELCEQENILLPMCYPLTKVQEQQLREVRRRIRNKRSAQHSRRRKQDYIESLEAELGTISAENGDLRRQLQELSAENRHLANELRRFQSSFVKSHRNGVQTATSLAVMLLSVCMLVSPTAASGASAVGGGRESFCLQRRQLQQQLQQQNVGGLNLVQPQNLLYQLKAANNYRLPIEAAGNGDDSALYQQKEFLGTVVTSGGGPNFGSFGAAKKNSENGAFGWNNAREPPITAAKSFAPPYFPFSDATDDDHGNYCAGNGNGNNFFNVDKVDDVGFGNEEENDDGGILMGNLLMNFDDDQLINMALGADEIGGAAVDEDEMEEEKVDDREGEFLRKNFYGEEEEGRSDGLLFQAESFSSLASSRNSHSSQMSSSACFESPEEAEAYLLWDDEDEHKMMMATTGKKMRNKGDCSDETSLEALLREEF